MDKEQCVVDMFSQEYGATIRSCLDCGVLIIGGATRCGFCAYRYGANGWWGRLTKKSNRVNMILVLSGWVLLAVGLGTFIPHSEPFTMIIRLSLSGMAMLLFAIYGVRGK